MLRCRLDGEDDFSGAHYRRGWLSGHEARAPRTWRWTTTPLTRVAGAPVANSATLREVELRCNDTPADHVEQELEYFDGAFIKRRRGRTGGQCHDEVPEGCLEGPDVTAQHGVAPVAAKVTQPGASAAMSDTGARGERKLREGWCTILCRGEELALSMGEQLEAGPAGVVSGAALPRNGRSTTRPICQTASGAQGPAAKAAAQNEPLAAAAAHAVWVCDSDSDDAEIEAITDNLLQCRVSDQPVWLRKVQTPPRAQWEDPAVRNEAISPSSSTSSVDTYTFVLEDERWQAENRHAIFAAM